MKTESNRLLYLACRYIDNLLANCDPERLSMDSITGFMRNAGGRLGYTRAMWREALEREAPPVKAAPSGEADDNDVDDDDELACLDLRQRPSARVIALSRRFLAAAMRRHRTQKRAPAERVAAAFADALELNDSERATLHFLVVRAFDPTMDAFFNTFSGYGIPVDAQLALACNMPDEGFRLAVSGSGALATHGMIAAYEWEASLSKDFVNIIAQAIRRDVPVAQALVGRCTKPALDARDVAWMREDVDDLVAILGAALARGERGVNILLHGDPGVGKTELAKLVGRNAGGRVYLAGENADAGQAAIGSLARLRQLQFANLLMARMKNTVLLFDEAEDMFGSGFGDGEAPSKVQINRLLEENAVPTIWTSNRIVMMDEAHLRRFSAIVHMKPAPVAVRREQIARQAKRKGVHLTGATLDRLSSSEGISPGIIESASRVAALVGGDENQFTRTVNRLVTAASGRPLAEASNDHAPAGLFDAALCNADTDLAQLTQRLVAANTTRFSLLLHGAPGAGKTLYTRELAQRLGLELHVKRASDLLGSFLGETEKAIAAAFRDAISGNAFLVLDEADSLLQKRSNAQRSWEITQVNEMLTWMERHPLPFAFTTNFLDALDQASLRRFTFKIGFGFLTPAQAARAFVAYFGQAAPPALAALTTLTPGDFAVVKQRAALLGIDDAQELLTLLAAETALKDGPKRRIGF